MFFLFILILAIFGIAIYTSRVCIKIENLKINTENPKGEKINKDNKIYIYVLIFRKIKLFKKNVKNIKIPKIKFENEDADIKILKNKYLKINYKELVQNIDIDIEEIDLNMQIGTQDAALTAILSGIISAVIGIMLRKPKYEIIPIFSDKNFLKIKLDGIISFNLMQYIYKLLSNKISNLGKEILNKKVEV